MRDRLAATLATLLLLTMAGGAAGLHHYDHVDPETNWLAVEQGTSASVGVTRTPFFLPVGGWYVVGVYIYYT